jgi:hypothetical protein
VWGFIRRSHLTYVFGSSDNMRAVNINDQLISFSNMKQGDRELTSEFKTRFNNKGVGIVKEGDSLLAIS